MIAIQKTLVSEEIIEEHFTCDLEKCKGGCCVDGDAGAPLDNSELPVFDTLFESVKPYMTSDGIAAIKKSGMYVFDKDDNEFVTPLILRSNKEIEAQRNSRDVHERARAGKKECAYTYFDNGIAKCAIEKAYFENKTSFRKPVSCHLYPIRITKTKEYDAVNYDRWTVCAPACSLGKKTKIPVFEFVKDALLRKYGEAWLTELRKAAEYIMSKKR